MATASKKPQQTSGFLLDFTVSVAGDGFFPTAAVRMEITRKTRRQIIWSFVCVCVCGRGGVAKKRFTD